MKLYSDGKKEGSSSFVISKNNIQSSVMKTAVIMLFLVLSTAGLSEAATQGSYPWLSNYTEGERKTDAEKQARESNYIMHFVGPFPLDDSWNIDFLRLEDSKKASDALNMELFCFEMFPYMCATGFGKDHCKIFSQNLTSLINDAMSAYNGTDFCNQTDPFNPNINRRKQRNRRHLQTAHWRWCDFELYSLSSQFACLYTSLHDGVYAGGYINNEVDLDQEEFCVGSGSCKAIKPTRGFQSGAQGTIAWVGANEYPTARVNMRLYAEGYEVLVRQSREHAIFLPHKSVFPSQ